MMLRLLNVLSTIVLMGIGYAIQSASADVTLVDQGKSHYTIIIPADAPDSVKAAAKELQKDIQLAAGATLPITADGEKTTGPIISLGNTKQAATAGVSIDGVGEDGFRILTKGGNLYILGPDTPDGKWTPNGGASNGTANGVYTFLEDQLNVRWLMPGDLGRDVPKRPSLKIGDLDRTHTPMFSIRSLPYVSAEEVSVGPAVQQWKDRQRMGSTWDLRAGHNWSWLTRNPKYYQEHPEWFPMNAEGKRPKPTPGRDKLETTNPQLVRFFAEEAIRQLKRKRRPQTFSLSPTDGRGWSQSPESKALYDPSPSTAFDPEAPSGFPSMSSLVLKWYHDVSQIVAKEYPQGRLAGYIYADYLYPPRKVAMKLPDNFIPVIAPSFSYGYGLYRKQTQERFKFVMDSWAKVAPKNWFYYDLPIQLLRQDNNEIGGGNFPGNAAIVTPAAPDILNLIFSTMVRDRLKGDAHIYGAVSWSNVAMANYMLAQLLWNPTRDAHDLQKEWLNRAYGPRAGAVMLQFYQKLNGWFADYWEKNEKQGYKVTLALLKNLYAAHYGEMEKLYLQAQAQPMIEPQKQRLQLIGDNLIALQWRLRNADLWPANQASQLQRGDEQVIALLGQSTDGFQKFPGILRGNFGRGIRAANRKAQADMKGLTMRAIEGKAPKSDVRAPELDPSSYLIYPRRDMEVRIVPKRISTGAYFATYLITTDYSKILSGSMTDMLASGYFEAGKPITFSAKANTPYYLYIPNRKTVEYELTVENACTARWRVEDKTLTLYGGTAPIYVWHTSRHRWASGSAFDSKDAVTIKNSRGAAEQAYLQRKGYQNVQMAQILDENWRFSPDPTNDGLARGVTRSDFDDSGWKTLTALSWWQSQGFADYKGSAWYRIHFTAPPLEAKQRALLYFGAVDGNADIYVSGRKVREYRQPDDFKEGNNRPIFADITSALRPQDNIIAARVVTRGRGSGIFGGVALLTAWSN